MPRKTQDTLAQSTNDYRTAVRELKVLVTREARLTKELKAVQDEIATVKESIATAREQMLAEAEV